MKNILKPRGAPRIATSLLILAAVSAAALAGWAFGKRGWAEKTGGKIDKAVGRAKQAAEELIGEDGPMKRAGRKVDEALE